MKKYLRTRLDRLDARGLAPAMTVTIVMDLCATQREYEQAFALACQKVPDGAVVYCWLRPLRDAEYIAMATGHLLQPERVMGIYRKLQPLAATT